MEPDFLERLNEKLGRPKWFWPLNGFILFVLYVLGSSVAPTNF